ncbi:hypothetical protein FHS85_001630 [Rhodoligotrophos appendicifer]|uniref:Zn-ribbon domain-containing OB-fold protein n=1 Tax=Rhodoligotrophos appendicifer TaxID=987056 RepID=UPI0011862419|nr:OB-fold domain-containing protein [Rhodoligotrophos appendicifer]
MNSESSIPSPTRTPETDEFWDAADNSQLLVGHCESCRKPHYYPRRICPFCLSTAVVWRAARGEGRIYSFSVVRRAVVPYVTALVTLPEGVTLMTNIIDADPEGMRIGDRVRAVFVPAEDGQLVPFFTPDP